MSEALRDLLVFCLGLLGLFTVFIAVNPNETLAGVTLLIGAIVITALNKIKL